MKIRNCLWSEINVSITDKKKKKELSSSIVLRMISINNLHNSHLKGRRADSEQYLYTNYANHGKKVTIIYLCFK